MATKKAAKAQPKTRTTRAEKPEKATRKPRTLKTIEEVKMAANIAPNESKQIDNLNSAQTDTPIKEPAKVKVIAGTDADAHARIDSIVLGLRAHGIVIAGEHVTQAAAGQPYMMAKAVPAARSASQAKKAAKVPAKK